MPRKRAHIKSLSSKIFTSVLLFTLAVIVVIALVLTTIFYYSYESDVEQRLLRRTGDIASVLNDQTPADQVKELSEQVKGRLRYTLIGSDGEVLYDSVADTTELDNHGDRPEVIEAATDGHAKIRRFSETIGTDTIYVAVRLDDGGIMRLSENRESLLAFMAGLVAPVVIALIIAGVLALLLSRALTKRIMKPIDALDFTEPLDNEIYVEMDPLLVRIDEQQNMLKAQNEELALAANMRREFSSNVSHELKTPLQVISGYAELMQNGMVNPDDNRRFAGLIYEEAQSMRSLIDDVLTLSRLDETAYDQSTAVSVEVRAVANRIAGRLASLASEHKVSVHVEGVRAWIAGSDTLVEEMLYNLVENGIRYNREGGTVTVRIEQEEVVRPFANADRGLSPQEASQIINNAALVSVPRQKQVVIRVIDNGPGIPEDMRDKIFERFYRMEKSRSKETGGTGLGLAIVKHAVLYHNGTIHVDSKVGEGSTFTLRFPAAK